MRAGALDQRVTIQEAAIMKSSTGADVETMWVDVAANVPASVRPGRGSRPQGERFKAGRDITEQWFEVELRRRAGIRPDMRLLWTSQLRGSLVLDIRSVDPVNDRGSSLLLQCRVI